MDAPEIRVSPDGRDVVIRNLSEFADHPVLRWRSTDLMWFTDDEVADWIPLAPVSTQVGA